MGAPPSVRYCLGRPPPMRAPTPPAGTTATALLAVISGGPRLPACGGLEMAPALPPLAWRLRRSLSSSREPLLFLQTGEDHAAGCGLEDRGDRGADLLADQPLAVVHDHHGAVVEVGDTLADFLALLDDVDVDDLAGQHHRLERVRQLVDVEHRDARQLGDFVEVVVIGDYLGAHHLAQLDQLAVHLTHVREVLVLDPDGRSRNALQALEDVEPALAPVALERVGRVGDLLELPEDELRDDQRAFEEADLAEIHDAAVDDH